MDEFVLFAFYSSWQTNQIRPFIYWGNLRLANLLFGFIWPLKMCPNFVGSFENLSIRYEEKWEALVHLNVQQIVKSSMDSIPQILFKNLWNGKWQVNHWIFLSNWSLCNNSLRGHQKEPNLPILLRIWIAIQFTVWNCMKCHFLNCISIINGQNFGQYSLQILNCILTV